MKLKLFYFLCLAIIIASCNNEDLTKTVVAPPVPVYNLQGCYMMKIDKDTALLNLNIQGDSVNGTLVYNRLKKRDVAGAFKGILDKNKIRIWYNSSVKEKAFVKQLHFKIIDDKLAEGYGDVIMRNDTAFYKYPTTLRYEDQHPFIKIPCK